MAGEFNFGLFTPDREQPQQLPRSVISNSGDAGASIIDAARSWQKEDSFGYLTKIIRSKQRMSTLKEARAQGLDPSQEEYYSFVRDRLMDLNDAEGSEIAEGRRMQTAEQIEASRARESTIRHQDTGTRGMQQDQDNNLAERRVIVGEHGVEQASRASDLAERKQAWVEKTYQTPESKWGYEARELGLKHRYDVDLQNLATRQALEVAAIKYGMEGQKPLSTSEVTTGSKFFLGEMGRASATKDPEMANFKILWENHLGVSIDDVLKGLGAEKSSEEYAKAKAAADFAGVEIAAKRKALARAYPGADDLDLLKKAMESPIGARLIVQPNGQVFWQGPEGTIYEVID